MADEVAHFLFNEHLWNSPPNDALSKALSRSGYRMVCFSPAQSSEIELLPVQYGLRWLIRNLFNPRWRQYAAFSATSEDPVVIAGLLSLVWRKPLIFLADEIKSGSYRGDRPRYWKMLCRWAMRRAAVTIVNDVSRMSLQRQYASLADSHDVVVYPGCFLHPPQILPDQQTPMRQDKVLCLSGGCNLSGGLDWALESLQHYSTLRLLVQPLGMGELEEYLLRHHRFANRMVIEEGRLGWQEAWQSMAQADIGVAVYRNPAPQFQHMGISSNRLCMFLAMGIPVIVNRQPSFAFVEDYGCGFMVDSCEEFVKAVGSIVSNNEDMKIAAKRCAAEYIDTDGKFGKLCESISRVMGKGARA